MKLIEQLFNPSQFTLLTAPVAAGKTRLVVEFYREHQFKVIFVSPLRALANEVYAKLESTEKNIFLAGGKVPLEDCMVNFLAARKAFLVATMELLSWTNFIFFIIGEKASGPFCTIDSWPSWTHRHQF
jgi:replicative superfamily II helicase